MTTRMGMEYFGGQHVFSSEGPQAVMDSKRGKPGWMRSLIDGYIDVREREVAESWKVVATLYKRDLDRLGKAPFADPLSLQGRLNIPPRTHAIVHGNESQLFIRPPKCFVKPMSSRQERIAEILEQLLTAHWERDSFLNGQVRLCLRDTGKVGHSWMTTECWQENPNAERLARRKRQRMAERLQEDAVGGEDLAHQIAMMASSVDSVNAPAQNQVAMKRDSRVVYRRIVNSRIPFWNGAMDPNATCIEDAEWFFEYMTKPLHAVKRDRSLKNTANLKANRSLRGRFGNAAQDLNRFGASETNIPDEYQYVGIWSGFVRNDDGGFDKKIFAEDHDEWLFEDADHYDLGCPVSMLRWNHTGDEIFATSDVALVLDQIVEEIQLRTRLFDASMRDLNDTGFFNKDKISEAEFGQIVSLPGVGKLVPIANLGNLDINQVITYPRRQDRTQQILPHLSIVQRDIEMGQGHGPNQMLQAMKSDTSATEASVIEARARAQEAVKAFWFDNFMEDVGHKTIQQAGQFYGPDVIAQSCGQEAAAVWVMEDYTPDDIKFGMAVRIEKGSMAPTNDEQRYQTYSEMVQEALVNPMAAMITNVPEAQRRRMLARGVQDGSSVLMPGVSAEAFSAASTKMALMKQGGTQGGGGSPPAEKPPSAEGAAAAQPNQGVA